MTVDKISFPPCVGTPNRIHGTQFHSEIMSIAVLVTLPLFAAVVSCRAGSFK